MTIKFIFMLCDSKKLFSLLTMLVVNFFILPCNAADELPDYDIVLFDLHQDNGKYSLGNPVLVAESSDYDNQPRFSTDGKLLYFTHMQQGIADIWVWSTQDKKAQALVTSPLSEFSPTPIPTMQESLSIVRVEADLSQRLWKYDEKSGFTLLFSEIKPVGYHAWSGSNLALFVLGDPQQLQVTRLGESHGEIVDSHIGRCLQTAPEMNAVTYTVESDKGWLVKRFDFDRKSAESLIQLPPGSEDYVWYDKQKIIGSDGKQLMIASTASQLGWQSIQNTTKFELSGISRLALSPDKSRIAVVFIKPSPSN